MSDTATRWTLFVAVIMLALGRFDSARSNSHALQESTAVIAGWNIAGFEPIPDAAVDRIAQVIQALDPHLIVLTEVNPNDVPEKIVERLGPEYDHPIIFQQGFGVSQNIALIFKQGVRVTGAELLEGSELAEEDRLRKALAADVRIGKFDFVLIGVHLKSSRDNISREKRTRQCREIEKYISQATAGQEKDVLVVGDYNMIPRMGSKANDEENFFALSPNNFLRFVSSDFLLNQTSHIGGCNPLRGNLLDGYAISRKFTKKEYVAGSTRLVTFAELGMSCSSFRKNVSDHRPIVSVFRTTADDD